MDVDRWMRDEVVHLRSPQYQAFDTLAQTMGFLHDLPTGKVHGTQLHDLFEHACARRTFGASRCVQLRAPTHYGEFR
jgi:hypothetical protein